ncbi:hypothetical protein [Caldilinea sp.]|jgi:hypothetical protein|uniref:hypothetical protein n=1 Tax=Caldilinea sp. TaxID=2293560 RepID=UPI001B26737B|nr:hypothetical protein [Caldilinea sp.]MBO9394364.1 hypothetical protein [Caldilinea sp.]
MTEWQIPERAQALLRQRLAARQQADTELAQAVQLILAAVGAPEDAQIVIDVDFSMRVVERSAVTEDDSA